MSSKVSLFQQNDYSIAETFSNIEELLSIGTTIIVEINDSVFDIYDILKTESGRTYFVGNNVESDTYSVLIPVENIDCTTAYRWI